MASTDEQQRELITEAFIEPIRFALVVDDRFPPYDADSSTDGDPETAKSIFRFCRRNGWLCDIDDGQLSAELDKHLQQSDLLILDLHLDKTRIDDPTRALKILQGLAGSDHFNLVLVYTGTEEIQRVALDIAFSLGAGELLADGKRDLAADFIDEHPDLRDKVDDRMLAEFLVATKPGEAFKSLRPDVAAAGGIQNDVLRLLAEERFEYSVPKEIKERRGSGTQARSNCGGTIPWVKSGNVFVAVINKKTTPDKFLDLLLGALCDWAPSPLEMMMVKLRSAIAQAGALHDQDILADPLTQAAWMLKMLLAEDHEREISHLYLRLLERFSRAIGQRVAEFGTKALKVDSRNPLAQALDWARMPPATSSHEVYLALNEYLCSGPCDGDAITTGVVLKATVEEKPAYWLCTSPACDLVPGQNTSGWDGQLHPVRAVQAIRLQPIKSAEPVRKALEEATRCRHIFVKDGRDRVMLEAADSESRKVKAEMILLEDEGRIANQAVTGTLIRKDVTGKIALISTTFSVVASLRSDYANRYLMEYGQQKSRIGVDYVDLPREGA